MKMPLLWVVSNSVPCQFNLDGITQLWVNLKSPPLHLSNVYTENQCKKKPSGDKPEAISEA
jgi:hypothetical protein